MSMTIAITRNLPDRFGGFLASCMLQLAPGTYVAPFLSKAVRDRVWEVMLAWAELIPEEGGVVLVWHDEESPSGLGLHISCIIHSVDDDTLITHCNITKKLTRL